MADLTLRVDVGDGDERETHRSTAALLTDIRALGLVNVARASGEVPAGGKSGLSPQIAELVVTGALSATTVGTIGRVVIAFVNRAKDRRVKISRGDETWEFTGVSEKDQHVLAQLLSAEPAGSDVANGDGGAVR
ncbi:MULTISPECIES: hypothetical protein [unclassified Saccharothrix]|uniref:hypothetical protein n=1 Tax=unclassified Saccharothrix TaxID=2593673 RepID=UPI00307E5531